MPKRYTPDQKQEALRLLAIHNGNVPIVNQLTGIPRATLYYWRRTELSNKTDSIEQKNIPSPIESVQQTNTPSHPDHPDAELMQDGDFQYWRLPTGEVFAHLSDEERESLAHLRDPDDAEPPPIDSPPSANPQAGVPGKSYPYPLEDDESDAEKDIEAFRRVRDVLMSHAQKLADNLAPDDPDINRRSLALSRILDRIHQLDDMLPSLTPEQVVRHEFVYDDMVHNVAPWERSEEYLLEQLEYIRKRKADESRKNAERSSTVNSAVR